MRRGNRSCRSPVRLCSGRALGSSDMRDVAAAARAVGNGWVSTIGGGGTCGERVWFWLFSFWRDARSEGRTSALRRLALSLLLRLMRTRRTWSWRFWTARRFVRPCRRRRRSRWSSIEVFGTGTRPAIRRGGRARRSHTARRRGTTGGNTGWPYRFAVRHDAHERVGFFPAWAHSRR